MIRIKTTMRNFGPHKNLVINYNKNINCIVGNNGKGKTFILESICACLFGYWPSRGPITNGITKNFIGDCMIEEEFIVSNITYIATRKIKIMAKTINQEALLSKKTNNVIELIAGPDLNSFNNSVENLICSKDLFFSIYFSSQFSKNEIVDITQMERKKIFNNLLGLDHLGEISQKFKDIRQKFDLEITKIRNEMAIIESEISQGILEIDLVNSRIEFEKLQEEIKQLDNCYKKTLEKHRETEKNMRYAKELQEKKEALEKLEIDKDNLKKYLIESIQKIPNPGIKNTALRAFRDKLSKQIKEQELKIAELTRQAHAINNRIVKYETVDKIKNEKSKKLTFLKDHELKTDKKIKINDYVFEAFGPNGIQALLIEKSIPEIQNIANKLLSSLKDFNFRIEIKTIKINKDGTNKESLELLCYNNNSKLDIKLFSGGEQKIFKTVIRLALAIYNSSSQQKQVSTIHFDELFETLDSENTEYIIDLLKATKNYFEKIIFVTHNDNLVFDECNKIYV